MLILIIIAPLAKIFSKYYPILFTNPYYIKSLFRVNALNYLSLPQDPLYEEFPAQVLWFFLNYFTILTSIVQLSHKNRSIFVHSINPLLHHSLITKLII